MLGLGRMSILENEKRNQKKKNIISACTQLKGGLICKKNTFSILKILLFSFLYRNIKYSKNYQSSVQAP